MKTKTTLSPALGMKKHTAIEYGAHSPHQPRMMEVPRGCSRLHERQALTPSIRPLLHTYPKSLTGAHILLGTDINVFGAMLAIVLQELGATVAICVQTPTQVTDPAVLAELQQREVMTFGHNAQGPDDITLAVSHALSHPLFSTKDAAPNILIDDTGMLVSAARIPGVASLAVTTNHQARAKAQHMRSVGTLPCPVMDVSASVVFDTFINPHSAEAVLSIVKNSRDDFSFGGARVHVFGFGKVGRRAAMALRSAGSIVSVSEVDAIRAVEATTLGFELTTFRRVAPTVDLLLTATGGQRDILAFKDIRQLKCGAVIVNVSPSGHAEIPVSELRTKGTCVPVRHGVEHIHVGKWFIVLVSGGLAPPSACKDNTVSTSLRLACTVIAAIELATAPPGKYSSNIYQFPASCEDLACRCHLGEHADDLIEKQQ